MNEVSKDQWFLWTCNISRSPIQIWPSCCFYVPLRSERKSSKRVRFKSDYISYGLWFALCCVLLWLDNNQCYPYPSGLLHWHGAILWHSQYGCWTWCQFCHKDLLEPSVMIQLTSRQLMVFSVMPSWVFTIMITYCQTPTRYCHDYCQNSNISYTKSHNINVFRLVLQLSLPNPLKPEPRFNIKVTSYQCRKSHCGDKTILRPSYLHNEISILVRWHLYIELGPRCQQFHCLLRCHLY